MTSHYSKTRPLPALLILLLGLSTGISLLVPLPGLAAPEGQVDKVRVQKNDDNPEEEATRHRSLRMDQVNIVGELEKPKTMFVIPRAPHTYYREEIIRDFREEILAPIDMRDTENIRRWKGDSQPQD